MKVGGYVAASFDVQVPNIFVDGVTRGEIMVA